jgi:O-antigen/teichoic acid export membrane protein
VIQALGRVVIMAAGLVSVSILTRHLGIAGYGVYTTATVFLSFFIALSDWGIPTIVARDLAKSTRGDSDLVGTVLVGRILLAIPAALLAIAIAWLIYPHNLDIKNAILILSFTLLSNSAISTLVAYFQARLEMQFPTLAEIAARLVTLGLIILSVMHGDGIYDIMSIVLIGSFIQLIVLWWFIRRELKPDFEFDRALFRTIFLASLPLGAAIILNAIYFKVDALILSILRPVTEVGIYGAAYKVLELILVFPALFGTSVFPILSRQARTMPKFRESLQRSLNFMLLLAVPIFVGGLVTAPSIIAVIGGNEFMAATEPLKVLLAAAVFTFINILNGLAVIALNRQKDALWINVSGLLLNVVLNFLFIPQYGYMAAAINTLVAEAYVTGANFYILHRFAGFTPSLWRILQAGSAALTMAAVIVLVPFHSVFIEIVAGGVVYTMVLLLLKGLRLQEIYEVIGISDTDETG